MRKFTLVLLVMIMATSMAFAEAVSAEWTLEASATATFGVNLDKLDTVLGEPVDGPTTGFALSNDVDLTVTFVEEQTKEFGEGDMYGYIELEDFSVELNTDDFGEGTTPALAGSNGDLTAKVFLGPAYIVVATESNDFNDADVTDAIPESILGLNDIVSHADTGNSVALGFDVATTNVELVLASTGTTAADGTNGNDWSDNPWNNYLGAILTETTVDALTVAVDLEAQLRGQAPKDADASGDVSAGDDANDIEPQGDFGDNAYIGVNVEYALPMSDMVTLVPFFGVDLFNDSNAGKGDSSNSGAAGAMDFEIVAGARAEWGADDLEIFANASDGDTQGGLAAEVGYGKDNAAGEDNYTTSLWVRLALAEDGGDDGLFPVVGGAVLVEYMSSTTTTAGTDGDAVNKVAVGVEGDADLGEISPFFGVMYGDTNMDVDNAAGVYSEGLTMNVGTDINIIPATTFTLKYTSGNLLRDGDGVYDASAGYYSYEAARGASTATAKSGTFTIATKVEY